MSEILKKLLAALIPVLYFVLWEKNPEGAPPAESFTATVLWLIGFVFSGFQLKSWAMKKGIVYFGE